MNTRRGFLRSLGVATLAVALDVLPRFGPDRALEFQVGGGIVLSYWQEALRQVYTREAFEASEAMYCPLWNDIELLNDRG